MYVATNPKQEFRDCSAPLPLRGEKQLTQNPESNYSARNDRMLRKGNVLEPLRRHAELQGVSLMCQTGESARTLTISTEIENN